MTNTIASLEEIKDKTDTVTAMLEFYAAYVVFPVRKYFQLFNVLKTKST